MSQTVTLYLTDKTGKRFWQSFCGEGPLGGSAGEERTLKRHLEAIKSGHPAYAKCEIDRESARFVYEGPPDPTVEEIDAWLNEEASC